MSRKKKRVKKNPTSFDYHYAKGSSLQEEYAIGREAGEHFGNLPYTGIGGYMQHRRNRLDESMNPKREDVYKDLGFADKLVDKGLETHGEQLHSAVKLYNLAIEEAQRIGDYDLATRVYDKARKKLSKAKSKVESPGTGYHGIVGRLLMLGRVNEALVELKNPTRYVRRQKLETAMSAIFLLLALSFFIFPFYNGMTGSVVGEREANLFGLFSFILFLVSIYFFFRLKRK